MILRFIQGEYQLDESDGSVAIPLATVLEKLPAPERVRVAPLSHKEEADRVFQQMIDSGVYVDVLNQWITLNIQQTQRQSRSAKAYCRLLVELNGLRRQYGSEALNAALQKSTGYGEPQKCTVAYLKTVLRNEQPSAPQSPCLPLPVGRHGAGRPRGEGIPGLITDMSLWDQVKLYLKQRLRRSAYSTWIEPTHQIEQTEDRLVVGVPEDLYIEQLAKWTVIPTLLADLGWHGALEFVVASGSSGQDEKRT